MKKDKIIIIAVSVLCIALTTSLVYAVVHYSDVIESKNSAIFGLQDQLVEAEETIDSLEDANEILKQENEALNSTIEVLISNVTDLEKMTVDLTGIIHGRNPSKPNTLIWHISEKGEAYEWGNTPDVNYTYQKILNSSAPYEVLLLPEFEGNLNWEETFEWISSNFTGIPIVLSVFEGGDAKLPNPNVQLTVAEIQQAMSACDARMIRLAEMISWYMEQNQTFPIEYIRSVLNFCRQHNVEVLWSEWKIGNDVTPKLQEYIAGFEDIVTVLYQTNSEFNEPLEGFVEMSMFQHWGASIQNWYWPEQHYGSDEMDMPSSIVIRHVQTATSMGAEVLQFESCRYFFDNGEPRDIVNAACLAIK